MPPAKTLSHENVKKLKVSWNCFTRTRTPTQHKLMKFGLFLIHSESVSLFFSRFGVSCPVCLLELSEPSALPCQHVLCLPCLQRCIQQNRRFCPKCRQELPSDFTPSVSHSVKLVPNSVRQNFKLLLCSLKSTLFQFFLNNPLLSLDFQI